MYPTFFNGTVDSYIVLSALGVFAAIVMFAIISGKAGLSVSAFRFYGIMIVISIAVGFGFSRLFQMLYNYAETGEVGTGITFLGGLIGGVASFFVLSLIFGKKYRKELFKTVNVAMPCIALGHSIGRVGCVLAGCCYGAETESFIGIRFVESILESGEWVYGSPRIPTNLIEAIFLLLLCISLLLLIFRLDKLDFAAVIYLYSYSVFRFLIEFVRDDPRGAFALGMSPSQIICIFMFIGAVLLNILIIKRKKDLSGQVVARQTNDDKESDNGN